MDQLLPIGRFSQMTRLSVKALRLYDELGLLAPAQVDPDSGYRYYRPTQANRAEAIRILRSVDMPLEEIGQVLAEPEPDLARKLLARHHDRLLAELGRHERMLGFLAKLMEREEGVVPYNVEVKEVADQPVLATRRHTSLASIGADIGAAFQALVAAQQEEGAVMAGAPFIVYHDVIDEQTEGDIEVCLPVLAGGQRQGDVYASVIAGGRVASTMHRGPYDEIGPAYHTLMGWISEHGHEMRGAPREVYLNDPQSVAPEDILTEVVWPID